MPYHSKVLTRDLLNYQGIFPIDFILTTKLIIFSFLFMLRFFLFTMFLWFIQLSFVINLPQLWCFISLVFFFYYVLYISRNLTKINVETMFVLLQNCLVVCLSFVSFLIVETKKHIRKYNFVYVFVIYLLLPVRILYVRLEQNYEVEKKNVFKKVFTFYFFFWCKKVFATK